MVPAHGSEPSGGRVLLAAGHAAGGNTGQYFCCLFGVTSLTWSCSTALTCPCSQVKMVTSDDELVTDITVRICLTHKLLRTLYCRCADLKEFSLVVRGCKLTQKVCWRACGVVLRRPW